MPTGEDLRFRPRERLRTPGEFRRVFKSGVRIDGRLFVAVAAEGARRWSRLGLTVSRRIGGAVVRNRAKRLLRETFRTNKPSETMDLVIVAKPALAGATREEVEREFRDRLRRLGRRWPPRPRGTPPPAAH